MAATLIKSLPCSLPAIFEVLPSACLRASSGLIPESTASTKRDVYKRQPYSPQMVRRMHNEIIKEAGIDHIRFTDLRHTCAILALKNGMDTKELAQMLGHYRPTITRQNYEPYLQHKVQKDEDMPNEATQDVYKRQAFVGDA